MADTVFYSWQLWTSISRWWGQPVAVQGAGRQIVAVADFDPAHSEVRESMYVYNKLAGIVHDTGARLLIVYFPLSYVIHKEDESRWYSLGIADVSRLMAFDAAFVRYLNDGHIPSINITEQLRKSASTGKRMYFWLDIHWTAAGNASAGRAVADYLTDRIKE